MQPAPPGLPLPSVRPLDLDHPRRPSQLRRRSHWTHWPAAGAWGTTPPSPPTPTRPETAGPATAVSRRPAGASLAHVAIQRPPATSQDTGDRATCTRQHSTPHAARRQYGGQIHHDVGKRRAPDAQPPTIHPSTVAHTHTLTNDSQPSSDAATHPHRVPHHDRAAGSTNTVGTCGPAVAYP